MGVSALSDTRAQHLLYFYTTMFSFSLFSCFDFPFQSAISITVFFFSLVRFPWYFMFLFSLPSQILVISLSNFLFHRPMHWLWLSPITKALLYQQHLRHKLWLNYCNSTLWECAGGPATFTCAYVSQEVNLLLTLVSPLYLQTLWPALAAVRTCAGSHLHTRDLCVMRV